MIEATEATFEQLVATAGTAIVEFSASWCGPCQAMRKILEGFNEVTVLMVDINRCPSLTKRFGIFSVPTIVLIQGGKETKRHVGGMNLPMLKTFASTGEP